MKSHSVVGVQLSFNGLVDFNACIIIFHIKLAWSASGTNLGLLRLNDKLMKWSFKAKR